MITGRSALRGCPRGGAGGGPAGAISASLVRRHRRLAAAPRPKGWRGRSIATSTIPLGHIAASATSTQRVGAPKPSAPARASSSPRAVVASERERSQVLAKGRTSMANQRWTFSRRPRLVHWGVPTRGVRKPSQPPGARALQYSTAVLVVLPSTLIMAHDTYIHTYIHTSWRKGGRGARRRSRHRAQACAI